MDTSTGLIAVISDNGTVPVERLTAMVAFVRTAREVVRAVVASTRPDEIRAAVAPAEAMEAATSELGTPPSFSLLRRVSDWAQHADGDPVRLVLTLDPSHPIDDPWVIYECLQRLITNALADGMVSVRKSGTGQAWHREEEWVRPVAGSGPLVEDPSLYVFRRDFIQDDRKAWRMDGQFLPYEILPIHR